MVVPGMGHSCCDLAEVRVTQGAVSQPVVFHAHRVAHCSMSKSVQEGEALGRCWKQPGGCRQPPRPPYPQKPH